MGLRGLSLSLRYHCRGLGFKVPLQGYMRGSSRANYRNLLPTHVEGKGKKKP